MKISVCTDMLYSDLPTDQALERVKASGADAFEFWGIDGKDIHAIAAESRSVGLPLATFVAPSQPSLITPGARNVLPEAMRRVSAVCDLLNCRTMIICSGRPGGGLTCNEMHDEMLSTLESIVPVLEEMDLHLLLEPLNVTELSYLQSSREAFDVCRILGSPCVQVLYDIYHMQYMEGNLINTVRANIKAIGHFHAADLPDRRAPGTGEIHYPNLLKAIETVGYEGYVGLEYLPGTDRETELAEVVRTLKIVNA